MNRNMPPSVSQPRAIPLPRAIDIYFEVSLYLLVLAGFGVLASTGGVDLPAILLAGTAIAVRGYLLAKRRKVKISERWTTPLTIAYFAFYAADYLLMSRSFLGATVHLLLFAVIVRMFSLRRERDYTVLAILSFLLVLASAVLTVDSVFLFVFAMFMVVAVATFMLMEMRHSAQAATIQATRPQGAFAHRRLAFSLARVAPALMTMILVGAAAVFFLLPRMSAGYLGGYSFGNDFSTGFSDQVQIGGIGQIQQSNAVVMHIQIDGDTKGLYDLKWRGVTLSRFDGSIWSNPRDQFVLRRQADNTFPVPQFEAGLTPAYATKSYSTPPQYRITAKLIHYRVLMEPIGTNVFFLAPRASRVSGTYRLLSADSAGAVYNLDSQRPITRYEADSDIALPKPSQLREAAGELSAPYLSQYLQLPLLDPRIPRLAAEIAGQAPNTYDKAAALEKYLKSHFGYTLQLPREQEKDPLANFLFTRKQGHCEYFASSMAVMLRTLGIPSRVVNGFRTDEFNDLTGNYVVRAKNAHAWVEAYFPGYGWESFDPTPAGASGIPQGWARVMLYVDAMASFWREWIISYDSSHQYVLGKQVVIGGRSLWERLRAWGRIHYATALGWARDGERSAEHSPARWGTMGLIGLILMLTLGNARRMIRMMRFRRLRAHPDKAPELAAMWYERMSRFLGRKGLQKSAGQTPREFLKIINDDRLRGPLTDFTAAYESARFGNSAQDAERLPELYQEVELATKR